MVEATAVHAAGAALAAVVALFVLFRWYTARGSGAGLLLAGAVAAPLALVAGYGAAAAGFGVLGEGVAAGRHLGFLVATAILVVLLGAVASASRGVLAGGVLLDAAGVGLGLAGAAGDAGLAGLTADQTSLALWGAGAAAILGLLVVLRGPISGAASRLDSDEAAAFSVLRNVLVGGLLLATAVVGAGAGVLGLLGPTATAVATVVVDLLAVGGAAAVVVTQRAVLEGAVGNVANGR